MITHTLAAIAAQPTHVTGSTILGGFVVMLVIGFFIFMSILRKIGRAAKKAAPYVAVPLILVGLLVLFPKLAPWFKGRWAAAVDAVRPAATLEPATDTVKGEPLYRAETNPDTGEVTFREVV